VVSKFLEAKTGKVFLSLNADFTNATFREFEVVILCAE